MMISIQNVERSLQGFFFKDNGTNKIGFASKQAPLKKMVQQSTRLLGPRGDSRAECRLD